MPILPSPSASPRTTTPSDIVESWVQLQKEMNHLNRTPSSVGSSSVGLPSTRPTVKPSRRTKSATSPYRQQPVESLSVSFAKLLVNQINGATPSTSTTPKRSKKNKNKKKQPRFNDPPVRITIRNNKPVTEIDHVEEWLQHRSAHYAWWRKLAPSTTYTPSSRDPTAYNRPCCDPVISKSIMVNHSQPQHVKAPRCILWFQFTGNPSKRPSSCNTKMPSSSISRIHRIRIEQQPLGGANALVFAADLHIGEDFAIVSRRQPGFTFSLTFFIDGVRHARLSGCCENARNIHIPTRVGGPIGAFVLRTVQGGEQCQICEKSAPFADPELFTVWPKSHHRYMNSSQESERSQDAHQYSSRKRSSLRRPKTADGSPEPIAIPNQAEDVSTSYSNDVYEQPSSDLLVPGFTSGEDTYEEHFFAENNAPSTSSIEEEACTNEQSSYEAIGPSFPCVEEVYEEEIFNKNFVPGSVSIEEVYSITSPIRTPESIPSSYIALNTQHDSV